MRNLTMLMDYYELTMANGYFVTGNKDKVAVFDMFYRTNPDEGGFVISAGLEMLIDYVQGLKFTDDDIEYLRGRNMFDEGFLDYLKNFKFTGTIEAVPEGTIVYPNIPIVTVTAPIIEAQLVETMLLICINFQSLIATKANRIARAAGDAVVMEFGARRAQGPDAAVWGTRACFIGGVNTTATVMADQQFGVTAVGTMAHSWIEFFPSEYEAFKNYAEIYPDNSVLLIDTYDILESGLPNAIKVAHEVLEPMGKRLKGVRIDSGDLAYFSKKIRRQLDEEGLTDCQVVVSNSVDEYLIDSLNKQGAKINSYGVGERMITSKSDPVFGGVYKLVAPVGRAAGLDDDLDVVAPHAGGQFVDVRRRAAQTVRHNHVLRQRGRRGHRDIRIVEEGRQLQVVFRKLAVEAVQLVQSFVRAVCRVLRPGFTGHIRRHIGQVVLPAVLQIRRDKVDAHGPGLILADGRQRFDLLIPFVVNGRHLIDL